MRFLLLAFLFAACLVGCRAPEAPAVHVQTREVRDDLGRTVRVPEEIDRAISLAPSVTEMIFAAGAGNKLVGVTSYCNYPPDAARIEKIGDTQTPNIEKIIALKPQIVFVSTASQLESFMKTLDEQGIAVYVTNPIDLFGIVKNLKDIGSVLGTDYKAIDNAAKLETRIANVAVDVLADELPRRRVFVQISNEPLFTIGEGSFLTELVERAGGESVTKDVASAYPKLSKETAAAMNPEVIFLSDSEDNREPNRVFRDSNAVKNGRVYRIKADIISRPGPRLVDALEEIAARLKDKR